ncbi:two-component sensor histidine kinase [Thioalkalivibrio denitrificans]|uniref:Sensor protein n=1 Tax=Thioalkalivibrio denitrificans TaxID=108003 RepID=A0A1V3N7K3_9GAMM|nr:heavy metal sensor histidine kinase [Thioalkalivibrio denitrificans]OOG21034.1 two-component sensor histidine kinase [Thioalkalivibrio denitrificans]
MSAGGPRSLSLTARFAILFAVFSAAVLLVAGLLFQQAMDEHFEELDAHELAAALAVVEGLVRRTAGDEAFAALPARLGDALSGREMVDVLVFDEEGRELFMTRPEPFASNFDAAPQAQGGLRRWEHEGVRYVGREAVFTAPLAEPRSLRVIASLDTSHHEHFMSEFRRQLWVKISLTALLAALLGWVAVRRGLSPLRRVTETSAQLSAERLGERLPHEGAPAEIRELLDAFNGMLDRLEGQFRRLSEFSADIAHELRTPVSNLMTETQVALSRARSADEYRETLHSNLEEFERMARMISDMLFLAKADDGMLPRPAERIALEAEARALMEFYEALAEERGVKIRLTGAATVAGDALMLRRALSNLLSNALRHTPEGGTVEIRIENVADAVHISVENPGTTIPPDRLATVFDRFRRVDADRSGRGEGAGLGLAITRSIVQAHGGDVTVRSSNGLTVFTIRLPAG